jgi:hypothetical protein
MSGKVPVSVYPGSPVVFLFNLPENSSNEEEGQETPGRRRMFYLAKRTRRSMWSLSLFGSKGIKILVNNGK